MQNAETDGLATDLAATAEVYQSKLDPTEGIPSGQAQSAACRQKADGRQPLISVMRPVGIGQKQLYTIMGLDPISYQKLGKVPYQKHTVIMILW